MEGDVVSVGGTAPSEVNNPVLTEGHFCFWKHHQQEHKAYVLDTPIC